MNNEPVAWLFKHKKVVDFNKPEEGDDNWIPLYTHPVKEPDFTVEKDSQDWKGMDGATAFWLVERHSNHWDDARLMMEEWLKANSHPAELSDEEILKQLETVIGSEKFEFSNDPMWIKFARAILRKVQEK